MNCLEFRRAVGAEPALENDAIVAHRAGCPACTRHQDELRALDRRLRRALDLPLSTRPAAVVPRRTRPRWAAAASVGAALLAGGLLWTLRPRDSLAEEMAEHLAHEPAALIATVPLPAADVTAVLSQFGLGLRGGLGDVVYAQNCVFRGHERPHFVLRGARGPVTVILTPDRASLHRRRIEVAGHAALEVPVAQGGAVVIGASDGEVEAISRRLDAALVTLR